MTSDDKDRHDLKNQLAIILGLSELLVAAEGGRRRSDFEAIHAAATTALVLLARVCPVRRDTEPSRLP